MSLQTLGQNSFQLSPLTQSPTLPSGQVFSEFLTIRQPPATEPWSHISLYDDHRNRDVATQYANYGSHPPDQYSNQQFLLLTDPSSIMQMHSNPTPSEYMTQINHQANSSNINSTQQPAVAGSLVGIPYGQMTNPQGDIDLDLITAESSNYELIQMNSQPVGPQTDQSTNDSIAIYPYPDIPIGCTNERNINLPSPMSPCESSINSFSRTPQGASPCNSFSPGGQSPDSSKIPGGGRQVGSRLKEESKTNAGIVRVIGSCWRCSLRRDSVSRKKNPHAACKFYTANKSAS